MKQIASQWQQQSRGSPLCCNLRRCNSEVVIFQIVVRLFDRFYILMVLQDEVAVTETVGLGLRAGRSLRGCFRKVGT